MSNSFDWSSAFDSIGSIGAALIGGAMSSHAAGKQFKFNAWLQKQASKLNIANTKLAGMFNIKSNALIPYYQRQGLERAGYNPMLAVQNGVSGSNVASTSGVPGASVDAPDYNGGIASGISNFLDFQRLQNETKTTEATADNQYAQADKNKAEKAEIIERLPFVSQQAKADYMKTQMESAKLENDIHYQNEFLNYLDNSLKVQEKVAQINKSGVVYNANTLAETMRGMRTEHLPFGFGSTYWDRRDLTRSEIKVKNPNDQKYWHHY